MSACGIRRKHCNLLLTQHILTNMNNTTTARGGIIAFIDNVQRYADECGPDRDGANQFIQRISEDYANIQLADIGQPLRFLKQLSGKPPVRFGTEGFKPLLVDDDNPARHYTAFVFVGYWLPWVLSIFVLYGWEILGFLRYRFQWSQGDVRMGLVGLRHGRAVRREGAGVLAELIACDLANN